MQTYSFPAALALGFAFTFTALAADAPKTPQDDNMVAFNNHCRQCHSYEKGDERLGPTLAGVVGRKAGTSEGYNGYSTALKDSKITWDAATLDKWITDPNAVVQGNNMGAIFAGLKDADQRKKVIAFLQSISPGAGTAPADKKPGDAPKP